MQCPLQNRTDKYCFNPIFPAWSDKEFISKILPVHAFYGKIAAATSQAKPACANAGFAYTENYESR